MTEKIGNQAYDYDSGENAWTDLGGMARNEHTSDKKPATVHDLDRVRHTRRGGRSFNEGSDSEHDPDMQGDVTAEDLSHLSEGMKIVRRMRQEIEAGQRDPDTGELRIISEADGSEGNGRLF